ncbi:retrovirus-related Pol polyprotein from transposon 412 isoform X2 [Dermacentor andersoni]
MGGSSTGVRFSSSPLPLPTPNHLEKRSAKDKGSKFLRRLVHVRHMDFQFAMWQMLYLFVSPQKVIEGFLLSLSSMARSEQCWSEALPRDSARCLEHRWSTSRPRDIWWRCFWSMYWTPPTSRDPSPDRKESTNVVTDHRVSRRLQQLPTAGIISAYEFKVMPFGLCSAPATFQRVMDTVLAGLKWQTCLVYLDDVVVFAGNFDVHLRRLATVLEAIRSSGLTLKPEKCRFAYEELLFLGHVISKSGVRPDPQKTAAIAKFPQPIDKKAVRRFLGMCAYYRRFVKNFSRIAEPLTQLTKCDVEFKWETPQADAFQELKRRMQSPPVLARFDEHADTEIHTDASSLGLGAVLVQRKDGHERVIAYASRSLSKAEGNYSTTEKECLAIVWATAKFRPYLYGRPFKVVSDHHALCWLANLKDPSGRLARWSLRLQEYDITVTYKSGRKHSDADCLSRAPIDPPPQDDEDDDAFLRIISAEDFAEQQRADPELKGLVDYLEGHTDVVPRAFKRGLSSFTLQDSLLVKKNFSPVRANYLLVVPSGLRPEVLHALHDDPTAGHLGFSRTLSRIQEKYYWPRLTADVTRYVRTWRDCQRRKTPPTRPAGLLQPIEPPCRPFQQIGMDLLGPFPTSITGNKWIVVATDYLTRFAETKALPKGSAAEVAKFFVENILLRHGAPEVLITD